MTAPEKILLIEEPSGGGVGRHIIDLAEVLERKGCEVHLIYSDLRMEEGFCRELERIDRIRTQKINMQRAPSPQDLSVVLKIRSYINKYGPFDIIHGHSSKGGALARFAAFGLQGSCVYTPHAFRTMDPLLHPVAKWFYKTVEYFLCFLTDAVVLVSEDEKAHALSLGLHPGKLHVVPNGIEVDGMLSRQEAREKLQFDEDKLYVGFVGRFVSQKSPETLVEAFGGVARQFEQARLVMLGNGPLSGKLGDLAVRLGIEDKIIWLENLPGSMVMPAFDIFTMPSRYEGFPYVLLEAAGAKLPIIATPVGGTTAVLKHEENGLVVPIDRPEKLEKAVIRLLEDSNLRREMGMKSGDIVQGFNIGDMVDRTLEVYRSVGAQQ